MLGLKLKPVLPADIKTGIPYLIVQRDIHTTTICIFNRVKSIQYDHDDIPTVIGEGYGWDWQDIKSVVSYKSTNRNYVVYNLMEPEDMKYTTHETQELSILVKMEGLVAPPQSRIVPHQDPLIETKEFVSSTTTDFAEMEERVIDRKRLDQQQENIGEGVLQTFKDLKRELDELSTKSQTWGEVVYTVVESRRLQKRLVEYYNSWSHYIDIPEAS